MTKKSLITAGWLAVIYAATQIPTIILYVFAQDLAGVSSGKLIEAILGVVSLALYLSLMLRIKQFLNERFNFHEADALLNVMILANTVGTGLVLMAIVITPLESLSEWLSVLTCVVLGVVGIIFSIKLLRLPDDLCGLLKPYAYTYMVGSVLTASVVLLPLAIIVGVASSIMLGMIFFRAADSEGSPTGAVLTP
ncbi:MAG TPA: hypothetical protein VNA16_03445 [Abditibacteriaceae bacterium]|nr:hypothetical protein [Abditibacteriaceae bacterium]